MHKFIINIGSLNYSHYGMMLYPEISGYSKSGNTMSLIDISSIEKITEVVPEITEYIRLHPFLVEDFAVCICIRLAGSEDIRSEWLYLQMISCYFRKQIEMIVGRCVCVRVLIHALVNAKDTDISANFNRGREFGWVSGYKEVFPDLTEDEWNRDDEKGIPVLCDRVMKEITDPISRFTYIPIFRRIKEESLLLAEQETVVQSQRLFDESDFIEGGISENGKSTEEINRYTACIKNRFADIYEECLREWEKQDVQIAIRKLINNQPDSEIREGFTLCGYLAGSLKEDYDDFAEKLSQNNQLGKQLASYKRRMELLELQVPECNVEELKISDLCINAHAAVSSAGDRDMELFGDLRQFFSEIKKKNWHSRHDDWNKLEKRIDDTLKTAEVRLNRKVEEMTAEFQKKESYSLVRVNVADIYQNRNKYTVESDELQNKLNDSEHSFFSVKQMLKIKQDVENENNIISILMTLRDSVWFVSFMLVVLSAVLMIAAPYMLEQLYIFKSSLGTVTFFSYIGACFLLFLLGFLLVNWMLHRQIKKHMSKLMEYFSKFSDTYENVIKEYAQHLSDILRLEAISQRLLLIQKGEEEAKLLALKWGWHRKRIREHLRAFDHFNSLIDKNYATFSDAPDIDPELSEVQNEAYWLVLKEDQ